MSGKWGRMFAGVMIALPLGACITMQKKEDGKTHISIPNPLAGLLKGEEADSRGGKSTGNACRIGDKLRRQRQEGLPPGKHRQMATVPGKSRCSIPVGLMPP